MWQCPLGWFKSIKSGQKNNSEWIRQWNCFIARCFALFVQDYAMFSWRHDLRLPSGKLIIAEENHNFLVAKSPVFSCLNGHMVFLVVTGIAKSSRRIRCWEQLSSECLSELHSGRFEGAQQHRYLGDVESSGSMIRRSQGKPWENIGKPSEITRKTVEFWWKKCDWLWSIFVHRNHPKLTDELGTFP